MNVLIGTILTGQGKDYVFPKFQEMADALFDRYDFIVAVDKLGRTKYNEIVIPNINYGYINWASYACEKGKEILRQVALDGGYDYLLWQGIDCLWDNAEDLNEFIVDAQSYQTVSALTAGRGRPDYPVAREYIVEEGKVTTRQKELPREALLTGDIVPCRGYPSTEATIFKRELLGVSWLHGYEPWYKRKDWDAEALDCDEFRFWRMVQAGVVPYINTTIRTWHVDDREYPYPAARYPNESVDVETLSWS